MKHLVSLSILMFLCLVVGLPEGVCSQKQKRVDPCGLIAAERLFAIFPALQKAEEQSVGPEMVCNYLDTMGIPALVISVSAAGAGVNETLAMLGSGYLIEGVSGLGDEAAIAIQQPNPKFGLKEGVAALHIKKGSRSLNFSFFRINLMPADPVFEKVKVLAAEMIEKL